MAKKTDLENEITRVETYMSGLNPDTKEYTMAATNLKKLYEARKVYRESSWIPKPDTVLTTTVSVIEVFTILKAEEFMPVLSKAFSFLTKPRNVNP